MGTSGVYRDLIDIEVECDRCKYTGDAIGIEDREDFTFTWHCPRCGFEYVEHLDDTQRDARDDGLAQVLVIILSAAAAVAVIGLLGRAWPLLITAVTVGALIITLALTKGTTEREDQ